MELYNRKRDQEERSKLSAERERSDILFCFSAVGQAEIELPSGKFLRVNEKLAALSGYSEKELLRMTAFQLLHQDDHVAFLDMKALPGHFRCICKDGGVRWIEIDETEFTGNGDRTALLLIIDRTEEKRQIDIIEDARKNVETIGRVKNEFLAHVSHELRTPLGGIMGMVELLMHWTPDTEQQEFLSKIRESTEALLVIVKDVLDLSSIDTGKFELRMMEFDLHKELERTANLFAETAREKRLKFALRASMDIPRRVYGDPARLSQILRNLIQNALKYTQEGAVTLTAESQGVVEGEELILFTVADTGPGILKKKVTFCSPSSDG